MRTEGTLLSPESRGCCCRADRSADDFDFDSQESGTQIFGIEVVNPPVNTACTLKSMIIIITAFSSSCSRSKIQLFHQKP